MNTFCLLITCYFSEHRTQYQSIKRSLNLVMVYEGKPFFVAVTYYHLKIYDQDEKR